MTNLFAFGLVFLSTLIGAVGALFLKKGSKNFNRNIFLQMKNSELIVGIFFYGLSSVFFIYALRLENLSLVYPITSLTYIWVGILSIKFLKEKLDKFKLIGMSLVILGVILLVQ